MIKSKSWQAISAVATATDNPADADWRLVEKVKSGNLAAFDLLVSKYKQRIYSTVYNITSNREDAADLTQETFIKAFRSLDRFRGHSHFYTWIYRIAVNAALSAIKRRRLRTFFSFEAIQEDGADPETLALLSSGAETSKPVLLRELQEKLNEALQKLSPKHRTVVVLFEIEGLSHEEIAEIVGTSVGTVRSRLHYAKKQLQGLLAPYVGKASLT